MLRTLFLLFCITAFSQSTIKDSLTINKEIKVLDNEAGIFLDDNKFDKSLSKARAMLELGFQNNDNFSVAKAYYFIGANYEGLYQFEKAIFYYEKGIVYVDKSDNKILRNWFYNNIGNIYCFNLKQYDKGLLYLKKAVFYAAKVPDSAQIFTSSLNIAYFYFYNKEFKKGKPYLDFINKNEKRLSYPIYNVVINTINGMYYTSTNQDKRAESYFNTALKLGKVQVNQIEYCQALNAYSDFLIKNKNFEKAYKIKSEAFRVNEAIKDAILKTNAANIGKSIEIDEYKRKIDEIERENILQSEIIGKSRTISYLLIISLFVFLLLIYSLYRINKYRNAKNLELESKNSELLVAKDRAEEASKLKSQFVSTITHELRTPLYGVIGITDMLVDEHKILLESPHLKSLKFSAKYLLSLINDVLQLNKIEDNRIVLEEQSFNMEDELEYIKNSMSFLAKNHNNVIETNIDTRIPENLIGDKLRLSQIILNLMSNALKFTQDGTVILSAKLVEIKDKFYFIKFSVEDNGVGIAEENQEKVFEKFTQVNRQVMDYQGTGLGLSIVKQLLELFKSSITLKSELGVGTTFTFTIGFEYDKEKSDAVTNEINVNLNAGELLKVLIVDDNSINLMITQKTIEKLKYTCTAVNSGGKALELLESEKFDVILMDLNMPVLSGFETTKIIRERGIKTGIIALTAYDKEEVMEEAFLAGFNDVISKPYDSKKLYKSMNEVYLKYTIM